MQTVYLLWHRFESRNSKEEDLEERAKLIGVYTDEEEARRAVERVKDQPGFIDHPDGFVVDCYELNKDSWAEGFFTYTC